MDLVILIILSLIFLVSLVLIHTRKSSIKKNRNIVISFLIIVLVVIFGIAIYDVFIKVKAKSNTKVTLRKKEQFGAGNMSKKNKLMEVCGLPKNYRDTSHCFNDSTHHTCCMLGPEARKYADSSGNPIGTAAKKAFKAHMKRNAKDSDLTPWCTCFGSEVCSFYSKKFNDGTHIKLINNPSSGTQVAKKPSSDCEGFFRDHFNVSSHGTPGVNKVSKPNKKCNSELKKLGNIFNK